MGSVGARSFHRVRLIARGAGLVYLQEVLKRCVQEDAPSGDRALSLELGLSREPHPPWSGKTLTRTGTLRFESRDRSLLVTDGGSWVQVNQGDGAASLRGELCAEPGPDDHPHSVVEAALLLALRSVGLFELHAAALAGADFALLLAGDSGSGKSTSATALLAAGCRYLGDDRVLLRPDGARITLCAYPSLFHLSDASVAAFPELRPHLLERVPPTDKWSLDPQRCFPGRELTSHEGPTFLLFPSQGEHTTLHELPRVEALGRVLRQSGSIVIEEHPAPGLHLESLRNLVERSLPLGAVLGPEWLDDPPRAARLLLEELGRRLAGGAP